MEWMDGWMEWMDALRCIEKWSVEGWCGISLPHEDMIVQMVEEWWRRKGSDGGEEGKGIEGWIGDGSLCNVSMSFSFFFSFSFSSFFFLFLFSFFPFFLFFFLFSSLLFHFLFFFPICDMATVWYDVRPITCRDDGEFKRLYFWHCFRDIGAAMSQTRIIPGQALTLSHPHYRISLPPAAVDGAQ